MLRSYLFGVICTLLFLLLPAPVLAQNPTSDLGATVDRPPSSKEQPEEAELGPVEASLVALSLQQKISQLMVVSLDGLFSPNDTDRRFLADFPPGGVVITRVTTPAAAALYIKALRLSAIETELGIPLLIGTNALAWEDRSDRPSLVFFDFPTPLALAAAGGSDSGRPVAALISDYMKVMGFNFHFGPSLSLSAYLTDTNNRLDQFGSDPRFVAGIGVAFLEELARNDITWIPMGFPGGEANRFANGPAVLVTPRSELARVDMLPYATAIDSGLKIIHVGNTIVPALDPERNPAGLSKAVVNDLLRKLMGFNGLVIAGPLDVRDISGIHSSAEAALISLEAGADMLYWSEPRGGVVKAILGLTAAVRSGRLSEDVVDGKVRRVLQYKIDEDLLSREVPDEGKAKKIEKDKRGANATFHLERKSVTLIKNDGNILPLTEDGSMPIGITGVVAVDPLHKAVKEYIKEVVQQPITTARHIGQIQDFEIDRLTRGRSGFRTAVCVFSDAVRPEGQARLIDALRAQGTKVVVVLVGQPDQLPKLLKADAIVLAYARPDRIDRAMSAVADILVGNAPLALIPATREMRAVGNQELSFSVADVLRSPTGRLPYALDDQFVEGYGMTYNPVLALDKVKWDFGDGKTSREWDVTHKYKKPGTYSVNLTVTDDYGEKASQSYDVVID